MGRIKRVIFNFKEMKDLYPHATRWQVIKWKMGRGVRNTGIVGLFLGVGWSSATVYREVDPKIVQAQAVVNTVTVEVETVPPVMVRIAACESKSSQYAKDGQVNRHVNSDKTVDTGYYMINSVWNAQATKLGYDLSKAEDNKAFGMWLYHTKGTEPWYSSLACWGK